MNLLWKVLEVLSLLNILDATRSIGPDNIQYPTTKLRPPVAKHNGRVGGDLRGFSSVGVFATIRIRPKCKPSLTNRKIEGIR